MEWGEAKKINILVTGGAGYIGCRTNKNSEARGQEPECYG